jgi:hypothetical protein
VRESDGTRGPAVVPQDKDRGSVKSSNAGDCRNPSWRSSRLDEIFGKEWQACLSAPRFFYPFFSALINAGKEKLGGFVVILRDKTLHRA